MNPQTAALLTIAATTLLGATAYAEAPAAGAPASEAHVYHVPPPEADENEPLLLAAVVVDAWAETALVARYRAIGRLGEYSEVVFERSSTGEYIATIPAEQMKTPGIQYFVVGILKAGGERAHVASSKWPHDVRIETPARRRWIGVERQRLAGKYNQLRMRLSIQHFRQKNDGFSNQPDFYRRGEFDVTHRLVNTLYSFTIGFGYLYGNTPVPVGPGPWGLGIRRARYGYGGVRLRFHESVYFDAQAVLGYSHDGPIGGARGELTFGRYWASCVQVGAEVIGDFAARSWVRLQWDTVTPLLMAAQVTADNFPDAELSNGSSVSFETTYPFKNGLSLTAITSYATRGRRVGSWGAGLAAAVDF